MGYERKICPILGVNGIRLSYCTKECALYDDAFKACMLRCVRLLPNISAGIGVVSDELSKAHEAIHEMALALDAMKNIFLDYHEDAFGHHEDKTEDKAEVKSDTDGDWLPFATTSGD